MKEKTIKAHVVHLSSQSWKDPADKQIISPDIKRKPSGVEMENIFPVVRHTFCCQPSPNDFFPLFFLDVKKLLLAFYLAFY